ncbi:GDYXXLXY domain-containing protein [Glycocaulis sp.]
MSVMLRLLIIAFAMSVFLTGMVITHASARAGGTEIRLDMEPVDPRDLLLGHYVVLDTPLHRLWLDELSGDTSHEWKSGDRLWVGLEAGETGSFQPVSVHTRQPEGLSIQGRVFHAGSGGIGRSGPVMSVRYNLERYFASPEDALALEELRNESRLRLIVSVGSDGSAIIRGLEIDGEDHIDRLF